MKKIALNFVIFFYKKSILSQGILLNPQFPWSFTLCTTIVLTLQHFHLILVLVIQLCFFWEIVICRCSTKLIILKKFLKTHRKNTGKTVLFCEFGNDFKNNIFIRHHGATASIFWADHSLRSRHSTRIKLTTFYCGLCLVICLVLIMLSSVFQKCSRNLSLAALIFYFTFVFALVLRIFASY